MSTLDFSVSVFQRRMDNFSRWWSVGFGSPEVFVGGRTSSKLRDRFVAECRERARKATPAELPALQLVRGRRLHYAHVDLAIRNDAGRVRFTAKVPLIVEPRPIGPDRSVEIAYHPLRPDEWFPTGDGSHGLDEVASAAFQRFWSDAELGSDELEQLRRQGHERLTIVAFRAEPQSLLAQAPTRDEPERAQIGARRRRPGTTLLSELGFDLTRKAVDDELAPGMPRDPYREQLRQLICGARKAPVVLIGPPGVGKTTLLHRAILDLLEADGWAAHQNIDRVHHVWQISGRRIIAGMSYLGQWEQRCVELVEETYAKKVLLWIEDLHAWGRIGESRQSDRSLSAFFRGPVARGELTLVAECTPEQWQQLQSDASGFANLFTTIHVDSTDAGETTQMLVHEARKLELASGCGFDPRVFRSIYELSGSLYSGSAYPGKALELVRALAARHRVARDQAERVQLDEILLREPPPERARKSIKTSELIDLLSDRTGMPRLLLEPSLALDPEQVADAFAGQVMGQQQAVAVVRDLIVRIKAGLCDPGRPYGVFLFTGPTGTGKTEMAKALAEYLFGDESRLVRLDMSEYNVPGAAARLIGDRWNPEGVLTSRVRAQPFCVVLLDEVEKADPSVLNLMLQLFDDGRLSDAAGEVADFRHAVVIMTSNLGAGGSSSVGFGDGAFAARANTRAEVMVDIAKAVREFFPPELFNRIDRVVEFFPLDEAAARAIARKELARLLGRRGLSERNSFVRTTEAVLAKIVREGFNARDGARSLKRWLEDNLGSLLVETLTRSEVASMRLLWVYEDRTGAQTGALRIHEEALREVEPIPEHSRLGELLDQPNAALLEQVPSALEFLRGLERSPRLTRLSRTLAELLEQFNRARGAAGEAPSGSTDADALYNLEALRAEIAGLRDALELHASYDHRLSGQVVEAEGEHEGLGEQLELDRFSHDKVRNSGSWTPAHLRRETSVRRLDRRAFSPSLPLRERQAMLEGIAKVWFLERALERADEPDQHVVFLELTRVGDPRPGGRFDGPGTTLFTELAHAYVHRGRGELEAFAGLRRGGSAADIVAMRAQDSDPADGEFERMFDRISAGEVDSLILQLVAPSVREFFAAESGCQVLETLGGGHEIVRVRVLDGSLRDDPRTLLEATLTQREAFVAALEAGTDLPPNPDAMLPILRRFKLEEARPGRPASVEVEDYLLSHVSSHGLGHTVAQSSGPSPKLEPVLALLWLMRVGVALGRERPTTPSPEPGAV